MSPIYSASVCVYVGVESLFVDSLLLLHDQMNHVSSGYSLPGEEEEAGPVNSTHSIFMSIGIKLPSIGGENARWISTDLRLAVRSCVCI